MGVSDKVPISGLPIISYLSPCRLPCCALLLRTRYPCTAFALSNRKNLIPQRPISAPWITSLRTVWMMKKPFSPADASIEAYTVALTALLSMLTATVLPTSCVKHSRTYGTTVLIFRSLQHPKCQDSTN